jgi:hypothetical protein
MNPSGERVTINELVNVLVISDEPLKFVLINAVCERIAETFDQCIETGLCSFGLMPTVKKHGGNHHQPLQFCVRGDTR